jgi:ElaB/YqjD/DUF883 family membrane-anchored ribosome-binding protein
MGKAGSHDLNEPPTEHMQAVQQEIEELRGRTEALIHELEHRIRSGVSRGREAVERIKRITDVKAQVRAHPRVAVGAGAGTLIVLGLGGWLLVSRARARGRLIPRLQRRGLMLSSILKHPERFRVEQPLTRRLLQAVLATAATVLTRSLLQRALAPRRQAPVPIT